MFLITARFRVQGSHVPVSAGASPFVRGSLDERRGVAVAAGRGRMADRLRLPSLDSSRAMGATESEMS